jgi:hypothetical protein
MLVAPVAAATGKSHIAGNITNASGNPLRGVIVRIFREIKDGEAISIARSNPSGFFRSASLLPGTYYLQVSHQGYEPIQTTRFVIDAGRSVSLDITLKEFIDRISREDDPRNWDFETVMRSTSDRRIIFRHAPGNSSASDAEHCDAFHRGGAIGIASGNSIRGESFIAQPQASPNGVSSTFAYTEPLGERSRMIFTGQLDFGYGAFWRVRDTLNYRPDQDHDYRVSVGYGRMNGRYPGPNALSSQMVSEEVGMPPSSVRTLAVGVEGRTKFYDLLAVNYGFDYSRLYSGTTKSLFFPSVQIILTPLEGWRFQTSFTSRRIRDDNSVVLPDGEVLNLSEPTLITMVGDRVSMSHVKHSEVAAQRDIASDTTVEIAVFQDRTQGPGLPLMVTTISQSAEQSHMIEMNEDLLNQRGMRLTIRQSIWDSLRGTLAYVYGDAIDIADIEIPVLAEDLGETLTGFLLQRAQHSITGRVDAILPLTRTHVLATVRWYPGNPLTPVDWFSDRMGIGTKSTNFEIRQAIPLPEFFGTAGQWEVMVNMRNVLNQGREHLRAKDSEIVLNRNPRSLRFGVNLSFH